MTNATPKLKMENILNDQTQAGEKVGSIEATFWSPRHRSKMQHFRSSKPSIPKSMADPLYGLIINQALPKLTGWFQLSSSALSPVKRTPRNRAAD